MDGNALRALLANNIKWHRANCGFSQEKLAELAGISISFLSAIETGKKWPYPETLARLSAALNISAAEFFVQEGVSLDFVDSVGKKANEALALLSEIHSGLTGILSRMSQVPPPCGTCL
ncbi:MAG: helix-turn-helix domain-containing protein [Spirochaetaceae bacterium]|jgi:transcriptional regulator with XRE-family HTH domain|nr:helix-turn-helix domain-containing protein [Spirochaetaceae bacterium]